MIAENNLSDIKAHESEAVLIANNNEMLKLMFRYQTQ